MQPTDTRHLELRCAVPPYASKTFVVDAGLPIPGVRALWTAMIGMVAARQGGILGRWAHTVLDVREPMALFVSVACNPAALEAFLVEAAKPPVRARLEGCPLWADIVGPLRTPTSAHGRMAILSRFPVRESLDRFVDVAYPLLVGPSPWANGVGGKTDWHATEAAWRKALGLPDSPADKRLRQAVRQMQRGRAKGPIGGDDSRRPPPQGS